MYRRALRRSPGSLSARSRAQLLVGLLLLPALAGCVPKIPPAVPIPPVLPSGQELENQREMLALAFISYTGELLKSDDATVGKELVPCVESELEAQPLTKGRWELAWGPAVYRFIEGTLDDNMMYVVRAKDDPSRVVVVVRGTNGSATLDWIVEDFNVFSTRNWAYGDAPARARISEATHTGLRVLQKLEPAEGVPGAGLTLKEYLVRRATEKSLTDLSVTVVGHSLGGALSPTLTLWLADTQGEWDPHGKASLSVYAYAGPTAGNAEFAKYSDSRIGPATHRVHNPYDVVPKAWNLSTLNEIPKLYEPVVETPDAVTVLLDGLLTVLKRSTYTQVRADAPPFPGRIPEDQTTFADQLLWQHTCGYLDGLKIVDRFKPVTNCAQVDPEDKWPRCLSQP